MKLKKLRLNKATVANLTRLSRDEKNVVVGGTQASVWDYLCNSYFECNDSANIHCEDWSYPCGGNFSMDMGCSIYEACDMI